MKVDIDYKFGQSVYLKNDPEQLEYLIHRVILQKGSVVIEIFGGQQEYIEVPEIFITKERDQSKMLGIEKEEE
jgi:hypothetical protein